MENYLCWNVSLCFAKFWHIYNAITSQGWAKLSFHRTFILQNMIKLCVINPQMSKFPSLCPASSIGSYYFDGSPIILALYTGLLCYGITPLHLSFSILTTPRTSKLSSLAANNLYLSIAQYFCKGALVSPEHSKKSKN